MIDYMHYKACMDDARKVTQEAEKILTKSGVPHAERKKQHAALLEKADKLRKLAMTYAVPEGEPSCVMDGIAASREA